MTRTALPLLALLGLTLAAAPFAFAQEAEESKPERPDDAAWTDDCPPDMMCAYGAGEEGNASTGDGPTYSNDCGGEVCAYDAPGQAIGPEGCIDCMAPPADAQTQGQGGADRDEVPGPSLAAALGILAVAAFGVALLAGRRR